MNFLRKLPIRVQLSIIALFIVVVMIFIIMFSYLKTANVVEQKNNEYFTQMIDQVNRTISSNCDVLSSMLQNICYSKAVQNYLIETDSLKKFMGYEQVKDYISTLSYMKKGILDIALLSNDGRSFNLNGQIEKIHGFKNEIPPKQLFYFTDSKTIEITNQDRNCIIVGAKIYSTNDFKNINKELGTLMILVDVNSLVGYNDATHKNNDPQFFMLDRSGKVFFSKDRSIETGVQKEDLPIDINAKSDIVDVNGNKYYVNIGEIPVLGGKIIFKIPQKELLSGIDDIRKQQLIGFFIALLLLAAPFLLVINNIIMPLKKFIMFMNEIKSGKLRNLKKRVSLTGYAEINVMSNDFNNMLDEIDDLTHRLITSNTRLYELELAKSQSELEFLKSQINPHFLYNTLESIKGIAVDVGSRDIFNMTKALGAIFKYSIKGTDIVSVDTELGIIKSYVYIQKVRFKNRLNVIYEFDNLLLQQQIPKMILQPIVENAIFHGIEPKVDGGCLTVGGQIANNKLIIYVRDDGEGIETEKLQNLTHYLNYMYSDNNKQSMKSGIGLLNVNKRIKLTYGEEYGININSSINGTEVILNLPI